MENDTTAPEDYDGLDDAYDAWLPPETRDYYYGE